MTETLFDLPAVTQTEMSPRCRMCSRSARWMIARQQFGMYCAGVSCNNRERICQACEKPFTISVDGAGTKYCSAPCKIKAYHPVAGNRMADCAWCHKPGDSRAGSGHRAWPYICTDCLEPIKHVVDRLKAHHVPHERARQLLDNPDCEICGADMLARTREPGHGKLKAALVVDHDHGCCPVDKLSCGRCIRGLICRHCNVAAGLLKDRADIARSLATYLERWNTREH